MFTAVFMRMNTALYYFTISFIITYLNIWLGIKVRDVIRQLEIFHANLFYVGMEKFVTLLFGWFLPRVSIIRLFGALTLSKAFITTWREEWDWVDGGRGEDDGEKGRFSRWLLHHWGAHQFWLNAYFIVRNTLKSSNFVIILLLDEVIAYKP